MDRRWGGGKVWGVGRREGGEMWIEKRLFFNKKVNQNLKQNKIKNNDWEQYVLSWMSFKESNNIE